MTTMLAYHSDPALKEEWRAIPAFWRYEASSLGSVRRADTGRTLTPMRGERRLQGERQVTRAEVEALTGWPPRDRAGRVAHRTPWGAWALVAFALVLAALVTIQTLIDKVGS